MKSIRGAGVIVALAAAVTSCGGERQERSEGSRSEAGAVSQRVELNGCLGPGRSAGDYVLERPEPTNREMASAEPTTVAPESAPSNAMSPLIAVERITIVARDCQSSREDPARPN